MTSNTWILLIWMWSGGPSVPAIPVKIGEYKIERDCTSTAEAWKKVAKQPDYARPEAVCLPTSYSLY